MTSPVVLGIDTSGSWCSAALLRGNEVFVRRAEVGSAHSERLLAMLEAVLADADIELADCDGLAFSAGPGSFTGLRVGCAVAQGLAFGASLRVAAIGTLNAIARSVPASDLPAVANILVAQDARMGEIYWSLIERGGDDLRVLAGPTLSSAGTLRSALSGLPPATIGCGNAWSLHAEELAGLVPRVVVRDAADAVQVAELGIVAARAGRLQPPESASPIYVRNDIARTTAERDAAKVLVAAA